MSNNSNNLINDTSNNNGVILRWEVAIAKFLEHLRGKSYSPFTIKTRKQDLERYVRWCEERAIISPVEITQQDLERYQASLTLYRNRSGKILDLQSQSRIMGALRTFYRYLYKSNHIAENPAIELEGPRLGRRIPRRVLTLAEVELMLRQPNLGTMAGLRDRAILETLYSTGIRRMELVNLRISDINFETGELRVLSGKGNKDRSIPIGERALAFIEKYMQEVRPTLITNGKDEGYLFLTHEGKQISADVLLLFLMTELSCR